MPDVFLPVYLWRSASTIRAVENRDGSDWGNINSDTIVSWFDTLDIDTVTCSRLVLPMLLWLVDNAVSEAERPNTSATINFICFIYIIMHAHWMTEWLSVTVWVGGGVYLWYWSENTSLTAVHVDCICLCPATLCYWPAINQPSQTTVASTGRRFAVHSNYTQV